MQKLKYRALRPFLDQNIVQIIGSGEIKAGVKAHFRYLLPDGSGIPQLKTVFEESPGQNIEVQVPCHIEAELELSTAYSLLRILGEDKPIDVQLPSIVSSDGGGNIPSPFNSQ